MRFRKSILILMFLMNRMKQVIAACLWPVSATGNGKILFNVSIEK